MSGLPGLVLAAAAPLSEMTERCTANPRGGFCCHAERRGRPDTRYSPSRMSDGDPGRLRLMGDKLSRRVTVRAKGRPRWPLSVLPAVKGIALVFAPFFGRQHLR